MKWIPLQCDATEDDPSELKQIGENASINSVHVVTEEPAWLVYTGVPGAMCQSSGECSLR